MKVSQVTRGTSVFRIVTLKRIKQLSHVKVQQQQSVSSRNRQASQHVTNRSEHYSTNMRLESHSAFSSRVVTSLAQRKLLKMANKLMKDNQEYLSAISFCSEAIVFNLGKISPEKKPKPSRNQLNVSECQSDKMGVVANNLKRINSFGISNHP